MKPLGNSLFDLDRKSIRASGFGLLGIGFTDALLLDLIRTHLLPEDLVTLNRVSKACYILSNEEEVWREMVLNQYDGTFQFKIDWKNTYAFMLHMTRNGGCGDGWTPLPRPLKFDGFYSDEIFQSFYCSHIDLQVCYGDDRIKDNIPRIHYSDLSPERFKREFGIPNRPVIITGLMDTWPCYSKASQHDATRWNIDNWKRLYGSKPFKIGRFVMPLDKYFDYMEHISSDESPLYLFDSKFGDKHPELLDHYDVAPYFRADYFNLLNDDPEVRPAFRWILVGPERSGSTFHKDPNHTSAWNALISGEKKWIMYPIEQVPPGVFPSTNGAEVATPISVCEWFINNYSEHRRKVDEYEEQKRYDRMQRDRQAKLASANSSAAPPASKKAKLSDDPSDFVLERAGPVEATCRPGEIIFIPNGWWHTALNLTPSFAVTQNYVNEENVRRRRTRHDVARAGEWIRTCMLNIAPFYFLCLSLSFLFFFLFSVPRSGMCVISYPPMRVSVTVI